MKKYNNIIIADIETTLDTNKKHIPIMIGLFDGIVSQIFTNNSSHNIIKTFLDYLFIYYKGTSLIYFHNFAKFDGYLLLNALIANGYKPQIIIRDGQIYNINLAINGKELHFKDSYLIIPFSLEKAAKLFNKIYFKTETPLAKLENWKDNVKHIEDYLKNDLFTLYELITNYNSFIKNTFHKEIYYSLTMPSLSQKIFLEQYYSGKYTNLSSNQDVFIRESYLGGIVDVYRPYGKDIVLLDFNSMYPAIMARTKFGTGRAKFIHNVSDLHEFCKKYLAFIKVKVHCKKELKFPLITVKHNNKNIQPAGTFVQTIYSKEILYCLDHYKDYYNFEFITAAYFEETDYIFKEYINKLYTTRTEFKNNDNEAGEKIIKLMMNSLYGRFGIKVFDNNTKVVNDKEAESLLADKNLNTLPVKVVTDELSILSYENTKARKDLLLKQFKSRVDWAAIITAESRIQMQKLKDLVNVYYMDTDSIVIEKKDLPKLTNLIDSSKLGYLKIEGEYSEGIFVAPKVYLLKKDDTYTIKIKGISNKDLGASPKEIENLFKTKLKKDENKLSMHIKRVLNFIRDRSDYSIYSAESELKLTLDYDKREKIYKNGIWVDTKPLHLNEVDEVSIENNNDIDI